ncbi:hypothetical protein [Trebonia kvetii]|nr:hypothetical protein [Trebonia kvetii]
MIAADESASDLRLAELARDHQLDVHEERSVGAEDELAQQRCRRTVLPG